MKTQYNLFLLVNLFVCLIIFNSCNTNEEVELKNSNNNLHGKATDLRNYIAPANENYGKTYIYLSSDSLGSFKQFLLKENTEDFMLFDEKSYDNKHRLRSVKTVKVKHTKAQYLSIKTFLGIDRFIEHRLEKDNTIYDLEEGGLLKMSILLRNAEDSSFKEFVFDKNYFENVEVPFLKVPHKALILEGYITTIHEGVKSTKKVKRYFVKEIGLVRVDFIDNGITTSEELQEVILINEFIR